MAYTLTGCQIVLVTKSNIDCDQFWLVEKGIFKKEDFKSENFINAAGVMQVEDEDIKLNYISGRIVITLVSETSRKQDFVNKKLTPFFNEFHQKFVAVGFNFQYTINPETDFPKYNKKYFAYPKNNVLSKHFNALDCRFGSYASKDIRGFRLKMEIKPMNNSSEGEFLYCSFNGHLSWDIENFSHDEHLADWAFLLDETKKIVEDLNEESN